MRLRSLGIPGMWEVGKEPFPFYDLILCIFTF